MENLVYVKVKEFKKKFLFTIAWRIKRHCKIAEKHLNKDEKVLYAFVGQKNDVWYNIFLTAVFVITNKRLIVATDRVLYGYFFNSITPDMFNDLKVTAGLIFGKVEIDTVKEYIVVTNVSKKALRDIETNVTEYMMREKKKYLRAQAAQLASKEQANSQLLFCAKRIEKL